MDLMGDAEIQSLGWRKITKHLTTLKTCEISREAVRGNSQPECFKGRENSPLP